MKGTVEWFCRWSLSFSFFLSLSLPLSLARSLALSLFLSLSLFRPHPLSIYISFSLFLSLSLSLSLFSRQQGYDTQFRFRRLATVQPVTTTTASSRCALPPLPSLAQQAGTLSPLTCMSQTKRVMGLAGGGSGALRLLWVREAFSLFIPTCTGASLPCRVLFWFSYGPGNVSSTVRVQVA